MPHKNIQVSYDVGIIQFTVPDIPQKNRFHTMLVQYSSPYPTCHTRTVFTRCWYNTVYRTRHATQEQVSYDVGAIQFTVPDMPHKNSFHTMLVQLYRDAKNSFRSKICITNNSDQCHYDLHSNRNIYLIYVKCTLKRHTGFRLSCKCRAQSTTFCVYLRCILVHFQKYAAQVICYLFKNSCC